MWEAITDPSLQGLGNVMLVVDTNRQSLDRVDPRPEDQEAHGGVRRRRLARRRGQVRVVAHRRVPAARRRGRCASTSTRCRTRSTSRCSPTPATSCASASCAAPPTAVRRLVDGVDPDELAPLVQNLGGHDLGVLLDAYRACDAETDRPSVVFAYTVKGWGLPIAGDPLNHAALLTGAADRRRCARRSGSRPRPSGTASIRRRRPGCVCGATGGELNNVTVPPRPVLPIPVATNVPAAGADVDAGVVRPRAHPARRRRRRRPSTSSRRRRTSACRRTSAGGSTRSACSPRPRPPTSSATSGCCAGSSRRPASTSSSGSAR